jgi:dihydrodipicolinate synthase/N-acetylneuraminate lyase
MPAKTKPLHWLGGFIADLPTPFDERDGIDWPAFEMLCEHQIGSGATAIVVGETMGESSTLERTERAEIISAAVAIARGRTAIIAGAGSNSTGQAIELTEIAESNGADAIVSVAPYYNKPMQSGILAHFQSIAASTSLPILLHDIPSRTAREISDETIARLAESTQFIGLNDSGGNVARLFACARGCRRRFGCCAAITPMRWPISPAAATAAFAASPVFFPIAAASSMKAAPMATYWLRGAHRPISRRSARCWPRTRRSPP